MSPYYLLPWLLLPLLLLTSKCWLALVIPPPRNDKAVTVVPRSDAERMMYSWPFSFSPTGGSKDGENKDFQTTRTSSVSDVKKY